MAFGDVSKSPPARGPDPDLAVRAKARELGFDAVAFSYPQTSRLGSSSLAWSSDSQLMSFTNAELVAAFDSVDALRAAGTLEHVPHGLLARAAFRRSVGDCVRLIDSAACG